MNSGEAFVGMKRSGSQLRRQNMMFLLLVRVVGLDVPEILGRYDGDSFTLMRMWEVDALGYWATGKNEWRWRTTAGVVCPVSLM